MSPLLEATAKPETIRVEPTKPVGLPRLNEPAPAFEAVTTQGVLRLADYEGSWLILFSHPADFTPVCTTEFIGFTEIYPELKKRGVELLGLSIDSVYSHIAWCATLRRNSVSKYLSRSLLTSTRKWPRSTAW